MEVLIQSLAPFVIFGLALMIYVMPSALAFFMSHKHKWAISFLSLMLGWTVVFWVACMTWALMNQRETNG